MIPTELVNKNEKVLNSFIDYCINHPDQRFWQALRNWSGYYFIYAASHMFSDEGLVDTFYLEGRRHDERENDTEND